MAHQLRHAETFDNSRFRHPVSLALDSGWSVIAHALSHGSRTAMSDSANRDEATTESESSPVRSFTDADGARWQVYERSLPGYDRRSGVSLIFASDSVVRRVRQFPPHWRNLSDDELALLSWSA